MPYLERRVERTDFNAATLVQWFEEAGVDHDLSASRHVARWAYAEAERAQGQVWSHPGGLVDTNSLGFGERAIPTGRCGDLPARPDSEAPQDRVRGRRSASWPARASASVVVTPANAQVFQARICHPGAGAQILGIVAAARLNLFVFKHDPDPLSTSIMAVNAPH